jgi:hypothetical protein
MKPDFEGRLTTAMHLVQKEVLKSSAIHGPFRSHHEGYAVILEETDELWDEVKKKRSRRIESDITREAVHVAAMAVRFLIDLCPEVRP